MKNHNKNKNKFISEQKKIDDNEILLIIILLETTMGTTAIT